MIRVENLRKSFKTKEGGVDAQAGISLGVQAKGEPDAALRRGASVYLRIPVGDCLLIRRGEV